MNTKQLMLNLFIGGVFALAGFFYLLGDITERVDIYKDQCETFDKCR